MKKILVLVVFAMIIASCAEQTKEDKIRKAFKEYVKTDFADENTFSEITSVQIQDTICAQEFLDMLSDKKELFRETYVADYNKEEYDQCFKNLENCNAIWHIYLVKVRLNNDGNKTIKEYYAIDKTEQGKIIIQDHNITTDEAPSVIYENVNRIMAIIGI